MSIDRTTNEPWDEQSFTLIKQPDGFITFHKRDRDGNLGPVLRTKVVGGVWDPPFDK